MSAEEAVDMTADIKTFFHEPTYTASHVVADTASGQCAIIDPVLDYEPNAARTGTVFADAIAAYVRAQGYSVQWLLETHVHADHLSAAQYLRQQLGGKIAIGEHVTTVQATFGKLFNAGAAFACDGSQFDRLLSDGDRFGIGGLNVDVLHTPGHTPACVTYLIGTAAFIGDTLFMPDYGSARCDFPGGDARALYRSIRRILDLPPATRLFLCHDYLPAGRSEFRWETTVAAQNRDNVHVRAGIGEEAFIALRNSRDAGLAKPHLLLPSVQVNMRAGALPAAEDNGVSYLKIPLNKL
jgi:glyoxylase-like metal-dependent hydrolase (beta-lactamase superfamily II)